MIHPHDLLHSGSVIWDRDYMRREDDVDEGNSSSPSAKPFDIFAGLKMEELPKNPKPSSPGVNSVELEPVPSKSSKPSEELPLTRLMQKYPRLLRYLGIAVVALSLGLFFGIKL